MALQTSGAISFTDLRTEYGAPATNVSLGKFAREMNISGTTAHTSYVVSWDGYHFKLGGVDPASYGAFYGHSHNEKILLLLDSSVSVPVHITSSYTVDGSSNVSSGVENNGSAYNASSAYHFGSYTQIWIDTCGTAVGNTGSEALSNLIWLSTTQAQVTSGSDSTPVAWGLHVAPVTDRYVKGKVATVDLAFPSTLSGGNDDALNGSGFMSLTSTSAPGLLKNGSSIQVQSVMEAASGGVWPGTGNSIYCTFYGYPYTLTSATSNARGHTVGTYGSISFRKQNVATWDGTSGTAFASKFTELETTPYSASGGWATSGWSASWSSSGATFKCTLTNNTGSDFYILGPNTSAGNHLPWIFAWGGSDGQFDYNNTLPMGTTGESQRYGQNLYSYIIHTATGYDGTNYGAVGFLGYHSAGANRATVMSELLELYNDFDGQGVNGANYQDAGITPGNSYGLANRYYGYQASEPTTGTLRVAYRINRSGADIATTYANYHTTNVFNGPTYGSNSAEGSTNFTPTITKSTGNTGSFLFTNTQIETFRDNMKMSEYYGGDA
tara:strand:+ start:16801 stop:18459 length:1659 start_codon:yes stop_codon:yes gene_type:complete